jgi:hypothetical protein
MVLELKHILLDNIYRERNSIYFLFLWVCIILLAARLQNRMHEMSFYDCKSFFDLISYIENLHLDKACILFCEFHIFIQYIFSSNLFFELFMKLANSVKAFHKIQVWTQQLWSINLKFCKLKKSWVFYLRSRARPSLSVLI